MRSSAVLALALFVVGPGSPLAADDQNIRYDPATVVDVTGVVEDIRETAAPLRGVHLFIKPESGGQLDAYLGPAWFVKEFISSFGRHSEVRVIGSKVRLGNSAIVLAREVRKGEITLYLRDKRGNSLWERQTLRFPGGAAGRVEDAPDCTARKPSAREFCT